MNIQQLETYITENPETLRVIQAMVEYLKELDNDVAELMKQMEEPDGHTHSISSAE